MATLNPTMQAVPVDVRWRIVSGMRWTFWLSVLAVPFSYGTSILLARTGPEVIGTYGLLMVYIGVVASLFYFGGDAVVIKFVPALDRKKRFPFLLTYSLIVLGFVLVAIVIAGAWPRSLHYLFGDAGGARFQLEMLCLSPLYVVFSLVVAAHKAVLEMRCAHLLMRLLTIGSFLFYGLLFAGWKGLLAAHYVGLIWGTYLLLTTVGIVVGVRHLLQLELWRSDWRHFHFFLPQGFWHYAVTTEEVSLVSFLIQRLDLILVLNLGGIVLLGKYMVILAVADAIRTANKFFIDTLLPSLANLISAGNMLGASQIVATNLRLLFLVNFAAMGVLILLLDPIIHLFGLQYLPLRPLFITAVLLFGLAAPGTVGGLILSGFGKQQHSFWVCVGQASLLVVLFVALWSHGGLFGAILASGISATTASLMLLLVSRRSTGLVISVARDYAVFIAAGALMAGSAIYLARMPIAIWAGELGAVGLFFLGANYKRRECNELVLFFFLSAKNDPTTTIGTCEASELI